MLLLLYLFFKSRYYKSTAMLAVLFLALIALWFLNYFHIEGVNIPRDFIFVYNNTPITLWELLILLLVVFAFIYIPNSIRIIVAILLIIWTLTTVGIISVGVFPLANSLVLAIIFCMILVLLSPRDSV